VDSLLGNLQCKCLCQNSSIETNEWAAKLLGERWKSVTSINAGRSNPHAFGGVATLSSGASSSEQRRYFVEPVHFTTLKRGGAADNFQVECIVYNGGMKFKGADEDGNPASLPYTLITFNQRDS
jgi:hypothetical protein